MSIPRFDLQELRGPIASDECLFIFEGIAIVDPWMDETMRFEVDPVEYYGELFTNWLKANIV